MLKITELYAFISSDEDGEGLVAEQLDGVWFPLIAADPARVESLRERARKMAKHKKIILCKFSIREELPL